MTLITRNTIVKRSKEIFQRKSLFISTTPYNGNLIMVQSHTRKQLHAIFGADLPGREFDEKLTILDTNS